MSLPKYTGQEPCRTGNPDRFFPTDGPGAAAAKAECAGCPLRDACLDYALHTTVEGIWGATSSGQRERMRKQLGIVPQPLVAQGIGEGKHRIDREQVRRMSARGMSAAAIAELLNTEPHAVRRILLADKRAAASAAA